MLFLDATSTDLGNCCLNLTKLPKLGLEQEKTNSAVNMGMVVLFEYHPLFKEAVMVRPNWLFLLAKDLCGHRLLDDFGDLQPSYDELLMKEIAVID